MLHFIHQKLSTLFQYGHTFWLVIVKSTRVKIPEKSNAMCESAEISFDMGIKTITIGGTHVKRLS